MEEGEREGPPTIFVSIPSYRDPECQYTVIDLFKKASIPTRVFIGICWQTDRVEDSKCFILEPPGELSSQVRTLFLHHSEARGPCFARALIQEQLYKGEDYYLQLDSHYRMVPEWDKILIEELRLCRAQSSMPLITSYPSSYTLPEDYMPGGADVAELHPNEQPIVLCAREFGSDGFLRITGKICSGTKLSKPIPGLFWAAGFAFSDASVVTTVPYDKSLEDLFFGEESIMAARLWTFGWDFFVPSKVIGYHLWSRRHRPIFREHASAEQRQREASSQHRVNEFLNGKVTVGGKRSLNDFEEFCGVSFVKKTITQRAFRGGLDPSVFIDGDPAMSTATPSTSSKACNVGGYGDLKAVFAAAPALSLMPGRAAEAILGLLGTDEIDPLSSILSGQVPNPPKPLLPPKLLEIGCRLDYLRILRPEEVRALDKLGFVVIDGFLQRHFNECCKRNGTSSEGAAQLVRRGALQVPLRAARLGRGTGLWSNAAIRGDEMAWLSTPAGSGVAGKVETAVVGFCKKESLPKTSAQEVSHDVTSTTSEFDSMTSCLKADFSSISGTGRNSSSSAIQLDKDGVLGDGQWYEDLDPYLAAMVDFRRELDEVLAFASRKMSVMVARYPGGGTHYARHFDSLPEHEEPRRRLTAVFYLNPDWLTEHGGCLRAYIPASIASLVPGTIELKSGLLSSGESEWAVDIEPRLDRLVLFASDWLEHEVLPSNAERYALTTFFY